ncbi:hypothetical protein B0H11DRAFT_524385 [Mycena galericulata]|nr:hypothetical protein B0H11DRAFT_524385 [Mycena galericulata]
MYNRPRWSEMHIIINWRTQQYCKITTPIGSRVVADLLPGHFILITTTLEPVQYRINVYDRKSLTTCWSPLGKITAEDAVYFPVVSQTIKAADISHSPSDMPITMAVHESPLESGVYRLWLHLPPPLRHYKSCVPQQLSTCTPTGRQYWNRVAPNLLRTH